jgi:hypothetical protein
VACWAGRLDGPRPRSPGPLRSRGAGHRIAVTSSCGRVMTHHWHTARSTQP